MVILSQRQEVEMAKIESVTLKNGKILHGEINIDYQHKGGLRIWDQVTPTRVRLIPQEAILMIELEMDSVEDARGVAFSEHE